jgi:hypothetical protein
MRKRSKYKPKGVRFDTLSWVVSGLRPFTSVSLGLDVRIKNHVAIDQLRLGVADKEDMDIIIGAFNMMEGFGRMGIGHEWNTEIRAGQDALLSIARRGVQRDMRFVATGPELKAINLSMEIHDAQLDVCTVRQLEQALDIVKEDVIYKRARAINSEDPLSPGSTLAELGQTPKEKVTPCSS